MIHSKFFERAAFEWLRLVARTNYATGVPTPTELKSATIAWLFRHSTADGQIEREVPSTNSFVKWCVHLWFVDNRQERCHTAPATGASQGPPWRCRFCGISLCSSRTTTVSRCRGGLKPGADRLHTEGLLDRSKSNAASKLWAFRSGDDPFIALHSTWSACRGRECDRGWARCTTPQHRFDAESEGLQPGTSALGSWTGREQSGRSRH